MYSSRSDLAAFDRMSSAAKSRCILNLVRALCEWDREIIAELTVPELYHSGVAYAFQGPLDDWKDIAQCLHTGKASCNSLTAWRCAELQMDGEPDAFPYIQSQTIQKPDGSILDLFHVLVQRQSFAGTDQEFEDPSRTLGMPRSDPSMVGARVLSSASGAIVGDAGVIWSPGGGLDSVGSACWGD